MAPRNTRKSTNRSYGSTAQQAKKSRYQPQSESDYTSEDEYSDDYSDDASSEDHRRRGNDRGGRGNDEQGKRFKCILTVLLVVLAVGGLIFAIEHGEEPEEICVRWNTLAVIAAQRRTIVALKAGVVGGHLICSRKSCSNTPAKSTIRISPPPQSHVAATANEDANVMKVKKLEQEAQEKEEADESMREQLEDYKAQLAEYKKQVEDSTEPRHERIKKIRDQELLISKLEAKLEDNKYGMSPTKLRQCGGWLGYAIVIIACIAIIVIVLFLLYVGGANLLSWGIKAVPAL